jgi:Conserved TM helix
VILAVDFQGGIENARSNVAAFVPKLAAALVILLVGYLVAKTLASILNKVLERVGFDRVVERGGVAPRPDRLPAERVRGHLGPRDRRRRRQGRHRPDRQPAQRHAGRPADCPRGRHRHPGRGGRLGDRGRRRGWHPHHAALLGAHGQPGRAGRTELRQQVRASAQTVSANYASTIDSPAGAPRDASLTQELQTGRTRHGR